MRNKKIEKTHAKEKQSHAQDNIYVVRQFVYVHRVVGISLLSGKNTEYNHTTLKNPNYKRRFHNGLNGPIGPSLRSMD